MLFSSGDLGRGLNISTKERLGHRCRRNCAVQNLELSEG